MKAINISYSAIELTKVLTKKSQVQRAKRLFYLTSRVKGFIRVYGLGIQAQGAKRPSKACFDYEYEVQVVGLVAGGIAHFTICKQFSECVNNKVG